MATNFVFSGTAYTPTTNFVFGPTTFTGHVTGFKNTAFGAATSKVYANASGFRPTAFGQGQLVVKASAIGFRGTAFGTGHGLPTDTANALGFTHTAFGAATSLSFPPPAGGEGTGTTSWVKVATGSTKGHRVGWGNGKFLALNQRGSSIRTSVDGTTWVNETATMPSSQDWCSPCWNGSIWVAIGQASFGGTARALATSADGLTWTAALMPDFRAWLKVIWVQPLGLFVAISNTNVLTSPDGTTWTDRTTTLLGGYGGTFNPVDLAWSDTLSKLVIIASNFSNVITSGDAINGTVVNTPTASQVAIAVKGGVFVVLGSGVGAAYCRSTDGVTFTSQAALDGAKDFRTILADAGNFVAVDTTGNSLAESPTGLAGSWTFTALTADNQSVDHGATSGTVTVFMSSSTNKTTYIEGVTSAAGAHGQAGGFTNTAFGAALGSEITYLVSEFSLLSANNLGVEFAQSFDIGGTLSAELAAVHAIGYPYTFLQVEFASPALGLIGAEFASVNHLYARINAELVLSHALAGSVSKEFVSSFAVANQNQLEVELATAFAYLSGAAQETLGEVFLQGNGFTVELESVELSCDEGSATWEATCRLKYAHDARRFKFNDPFSLVFDGELYTFVVDSRGSSRQVGEASTTLYGRSPIVAYQAPRAGKISKTWGGTTAASIAREMIPSIQWTILDWPVTAGSFGMERTTPYEVVARIAEVAGALVESLPDGTIQVRYRHPTSVLDYSDATAAHTLSDMEDTFTLEEHYSPVELTDYILIGNEQEGSASDRAEFVASEDEPYTGSVRVYPQVWRDNVRAYATGPVSVAGNGTQTRQETEVVEFKAGKASTRYPVVSLDSVQWNSNGLGGIAIGDYSTELSAGSSESGYSMAQITYTTKAHVFKVRAAGKLDINVQVVIED